jgi:hypothetical protein
MIPESPVGFAPIRPLSGRQVGSLGVLDSGTASTGVEDDGHDGIAPGNRESAGVPGPGGIGIGTMLGMVNVLGGGSGLFKLGLATIAGMTGCTGWSIVPFTTVP